MNKILKHKDVLTAINVCNNLSIDLLKDVEYLETKKAEGEISDGEYQDLHSARELSDAIRKTTNYLYDFNIRNNLRGIR
jgi:hypothetical protein